MLIITIITMTSTNNKKKVFGIERQDLDLGLER